MAAEVLTRSPFPRPSSDYDSAEERFTVSKSRAEIAALAEGEEAQGAAKRFQG